MSAPVKAPVILPVPEDGQTRPFWSVMIPTYNARPDYLGPTLRSILEQDPGAGEMQIEVVDDGSLNGAPAELVSSLGKGRIALHREPVNLGLASIWNRCIERARGEWIHILHQDDLVQPGFYAALRKGTLDTSCGAAFTRHVILNEHGHWMFISPLHRESSGILENWPEELSRRSQIQCASIVVRRAVYEKVGGFLPQLCFVLDWEMWQRIAARYSFWFEPRILAAYRRHDRSETSRLVLEALDVADYGTVIDLAKAYHPPENAARLAREARRLVALQAMATAQMLADSGHVKAAWKQVAAAWRTSRSWPVLPLIVQFGAYRVWKRLRK